MGIKDIGTILKKYSPNATVRKNLKSYKHQKIAIDISIYLYRFKYNDENDDGSFIKGIINQIIRLLQNDIIPVYIFDGKPTNAKSGTLDSRIKRKTNMKKKVELLENNLQELQLQESQESKQQNNENDNNDSDENNDSKNSDENNINDKIDSLIGEISKNKKNIITVRNCDKILCIKLFDLIGIPYLVANGEAEILCSRLCQHGLTYGCFSQDSDLMANGTEYFLRDLSNFNNYVNEYHLPTILSDLKLEYLEFVDLCILCGCDYIDRIKGIGPISAYKLVIKYRKMEDILEYLKNTKYKKYIIEDYFEKYEIAKKLFTNSLPELNNDMCHFNFEIKKSNFEELNLFLETEINLSFSKIEKLILLLKSNNNLYPKQKTIVKMDKGQKSIKDFFR